jgi:hypothetical protein
MGGSVLALLGAVTALLSPQGDADLAITRNSIALPAGCSVTETAALVTGFLDAFSRGDRDELDRFFAPAGEGTSDFKWFSSVDGGRRRTIYERANLLDHFSERHRHADTLRLVSLSIGAGHRAEVGLSYVVIRQADDLGSTPLFVSGKGQIDCARRQIFVWSMGEGVDTGPVLTTCPTPAGWRPEAPIVVCTPGPNARAVASGFVLVPAAGSAKCRSSAVFRTIRSMLSGFNLGIAASFQVGLAPRAAFSPAGRDLTTRQDVQRFVGRRYARLGEGWTLTRLAPRPGPGRFVLTIAASRLGAPYASGIAAVTVDCTTGRVRSWSGPKLRLH